MTRRTSLIALVASASLAVAACGDDNSSDTSANTTSTTTQAATDVVKTADGLVVTVDARKVVIQTARGEETFLVDPAKPPLGLDHIASHAGAGIAFRVQYSEGADGDKTFLGGQELGPGQ